MIRLSLHFCDNWLIRVGNWPTEALIQKVLRESVPVHPCRNLFDRDGNSYRVFAIYWHPDLDVVIKVDEYAGRAITVLSRENYNQRNGQTGGKINHGKKKKPKGRRSAFLHRRAYKRAMPVRTD